MSTRADTFDAEVLTHTPITDRLVRLELGGPGLADFASTGIPDEWVGLTVPGQFQSRYYTVRRWAEGRLTVDVVVHDVGLVTEWARTAPVGQTVTITEPKGSYAPPDGAGWLMLVGDLTALPAMARIAEETQQGSGLPTRIWAEVPDDPEVLAGYLPSGVEVTWLRQPGDGESRLADVVEDLVWPEGPGYFWMAGESAQMRAIRKHLMRERRLASTDYDVMGYWRSVAARQPRAVERNISGS